MKLKPSNENNKIEGSVKIIKYKVKKYNDDQSQRWLVFHKEKYPKNMYRNIHDRSKYTNPGHLISIIFTTPQSDSVSEKLF